MFNVILIILIMIMSITVVVTVNDIAMIGILVIFFITNTGQ